MKKANEKKNMKNWTIFSQPWLVFFSHQRHCLRLKLCLQGSEWKAHFIQFNILSLRARTHTLSFCTRCTRRICWLLVEIKNPHREASEAWDIIKISYRKFQSVSFSLKVSIKFYSSFGWKTFRGVERKRLGLIFF